MPQNSSALDDYKSLRKETQRKARGHNFYPPKADLKRLPPLYYNSEKNVPLADTKIHLHFFLGGSDWYVAEYDPETNVAWGYACLHGDKQNAEWGYVDLAEVEREQVKVTVHMGTSQFSVPRPVERDLYWTPALAKEAGMPGFKATAEPEFERKALPTGDAEQQLHHAADETGNAELFNAALDSGRLIVASVPVAKKDLAAQLRSVNTDDLARKPLPTVYREYQSFIEAKRAPYTMDVVGSLLEKHKVESSLIPILEKEVERAGVVCDLKQQAEHEQELRREGYLSIVDLEPKTDTVIELDDGTQLQLKPSPTRQGEWAAVPVGSQGSGYRLQTYIDMHRGYEQSKESGVIAPNNPHMVMFKPLGLEQKAQQQDKKSPVADAVISSTKQHSAERATRASELHTVDREAFAKVNGTPPPAGIKKGTDLKPLGIEPLF